VPAAPSRLFVTTESFGAFVSTDSGQHWVGFAIAGAGPVRWVRQDPVDAAVLYAATGSWSASAGTTLQRSDDGGNTWQVIHVSAQQTRLVVDPVMPERLWLFGPLTGLLLSEDRGATWASVGFAFDTSLPGSTVTRLVPSPSDRNQVYLVWNGRLYRGEFPARARVAVEYQQDDRFWVTADPAEAGFMDYRANDAIRSGESFGLWSPLTAPARAIGVCRFQGNPARGQHSRFITLQGPECEAVKRDPRWVLEGENEWFAMSAAADGSCAASLLPVTRFRNGKVDANYRYVVDATVAAHMRARGWYDEGVSMCARPLGSNE
jgi:hypothetical protein